MNMCVEGGGGAKVFDGKNKRVGNSGEEEGFGLRYNIMKGMMIVSTSEMPAAMAMV